MARIVFNGSPTVAPQRKAFYEYVDIQLREPQPAIECADGGEIHYDDGSIVVLTPGDWVVEGFDGQLRRVARELFAQAYVTLDDDGAASDAATVYQPAPEQSHDAVPLVDSGPRDEQLPAEPTLPADVIDVEPAKSVETTLLETAVAKIEQGNAKDLTDGEKAALQANAVRQSTEAAERLGAVVDQALKAKLVTPEEAEEWRHTGEAPEGVVVTADGDGYQVERPAAKPKRRRTGAAETDAEGAPAE